MRSVDFTMATGFVADFQPELPNQAAVEDRAGDDVAVGEREGHAPVCLSRANRGHGADEGLISGRQVVEGLISAREH